ncbi:Metallo-dependent phosphatase-like protein [Xylariaceae sp. FL0255]|nr:Metallo-dependent phosphatase-like protein [Xylariaceae sp. FL0255]
METISNLIRTISSHNRLQILSDLHLEVGNQYSSYTFPVAAPFLLLGGDIGRLVEYGAYREFLEAQAHRFEKIFLVLGNQEFYGLDYESGLQKGLRLSKEPSLVDKLVLLNRSRWDDSHSNLSILGCTLWSAIPVTAVGVVETKVKDFKKINKWTAQRHDSVHAEELAWLREQVALASASKRRILIATHHAPCIKRSSRPEHLSNPWTPAFGTDLLSSEKWKGVKTWVFRHTHYSTDFTQNGIRVVANQRGYVLPSMPSSTGGKHTIDKFDAAKTVPL